MRETIRRAARVIRRDGMRRAVRKLLFFIGCGKGFREALDRRDYRKWICLNEGNDAASLARDLGGLKGKPLFSVVVPVYNLDPCWLEKCLGSVEGQTYPRWELCLYDDASSRPDTRECLERWEAKGDPRIKIRYGTRNLHISAASNEALVLATGDFVALLDHDDELAPQALLEVAKALDARPDADMIYSDEDKISENGERFAPFFKPDWSPDLLLSHMYTGHLSVYRRSLVERIGGFRTGYEGSQDYDLVLRFVGQTKPGKILHIPKVLYHWRALSASTAIRPEAKDYAYGAGQKALTAYLERQGEEGSVEAEKIKGNYRIRRKIHGSERVSIVIVSRDRAALTECLRGIEKTADCRGVEIVVVHGDPEGTKIPGTETPLRPRFVSMDPPGAGKAAACNQGAAAAAGGHLLFLDEGLAAKEAGWLEAMVEQIQREAIGVVGGKILREDGTIVAAGLVLNGKDVSAPAFANFRDDNVPYFGHHHVVGNCSAVPADCLMVRKRVFDAVGGFDERRLPEHFFAVDLCLRVREEGCRILYTPYAAFLVRGPRTTRAPGARRRWDECDWVAEKRYMKERWGKSLAGDPYCNPNLSADGGFHIRAAAIPDRRP